jgi:predicted transposase YbfD/YdcC
MEVDAVGEDEVVVFEGDENGNKSECMPRVQYEDAEYISADDIGCRKSVYGFISNVQLEEDKNKRRFAYFNLATKHSTVNIAFPEAFYSNELLAGMDEFEIYISNVKKSVEKYPDKIMVIAYGDITKKKRDKNEVNVSVISPNRILVNNKTYKQIVYGEI